MSYHDESRGTSRGGAAPSGPAPITEPGRTVIEDPRVEGVEITRGVTIIAGDLAGIAKDPVYASRRTVIKPRAIVEKIPVKSVNKINYLSNYGSNIFNKTRAFESIETGEITFGSTLDNVIFASGGSFELKVNGDAGTQYNIVVQDTTNTKWYDFDAESFSNGFSEKIDIVDNNRLYLTIPPVSQETEYIVYFKPIGSTNYDESLPTQSKPYYINQLKDVTTTFKFSHVSGFVPQDETTITNQPNVSLTQGSINTGETSINITVKLLRSKLALADSKLTNPVVGLNEISYDGDETFSLSSANLKVSVNSTGTIGTISGTITLGKTTARDFDVLFRPTLFFKIT